MTLYKGYEGFEPQFIEMKFGKQKETRVLADLRICYQNWVGIVDVIRTNLNRTYAKTVYGSRHRVAT
jgi:hypothetical protein